MRKMFILNGMRPYSVISREGRGDDGSDENEKVDRADCFVYVRVVGSLHGVSERAS